MVQPRDTACRSGVCLTQPLSQHLTPKSGVALLPLNDSGSLSLTQRVEQESGHIERGAELQEMRFEPLLSGDTRIEMDANRIPQPVPSNFAPTVLISHLSGYFGPAYREARGSFYAATLRSELDVVKHCRHEQQFPVNIGLPPFLRSS